jgi:deoxyribodipyrimidine photolyase-related protein
MKPIRHLIFILGDQLSEEVSSLKEFDPKHDRILMAEVTGESDKVWSHKVRITYFLSAMRHFHQLLLEKKYPVTYYQLEDNSLKKNLTEALDSFLSEYQPEKIIVTEPGEYAVREEIINISQSKDIPLELRLDTHFLSTINEFSTFAEGRKQLRMEYFYRNMRKKYHVLMNEDHEPEGGQWNYDKENQGSFGKKGPPALPPWPSFKPDSVTEDVIKCVEKRFPEHPGSLEHFAWPVTPDSAQQMASHFIEHRLPHFGQYQDAMWTNEPFLFHSGLSAALNVKLLSPEWLIKKAEKAYQNGQAPLAAVEGFIRQILGWREFIRGMYWTFMPDYLNWNALNATEPLPNLFWDGQTNMNCLQQAIGQTLEYGYAHHIQRLMVTGLFSLLLGIQPKAIHEWYLAIYIDAIEWVELPNTLGMSQYVDGGQLASKPYIATGKYIDRMSNYCKGCQFNPANSTEADACPFTTFYWDFLIRHEDMLKKNPRMNLQVRNLGRKSAEALSDIQSKAEEYRQKLRDNNL